MAERTNLATQRRTDDSFERSADEIRHDIVAERETIADTVDRLGDRLHQTFDWREYIAEYPAVAMGLAAGTGILLSALFRREPTPQERIMDAVAELTEDLTDRISGLAGTVITRKILPGRTVKAAATAMIAKAAIDLAKRKVGEMVAVPRGERQSVPTRTSKALSNL